MLELKNLSVSSSPHIRASQSTASIMRDVCIALLPALIASVYFFGFRACWCPWRRACSLNGATARS